MSWLWPQAQARQRQGRRRRLPASKPGSPRTKPCRETSSTVDRSAPPHDPDRRSLGVPGGRRTDDRQWTNCRKAGATAVGRVGPAPGRELGGTAREFAFRAQCRCGRVVAAQCRSAADARRRGERTDRSRPVSEFAPGPAENARDPIGTSGACAPRPPARACLGGRSPRPPRALDGRPACRSRRPRIDALAGVACDSSMPR